MVRFHRCLLHRNKCLSESRQVYFDSTMSEVLKKHSGHFPPPWEMGYIGWFTVYNDLSAVLITTLGALLTIC